MDNDQANNLTDDFANEHNDTDWEDSGDDEEEDDVDLERLAKEYVSINF